MHRVVTSTVSFPVVSNESSKLSAEVVERLTAAGKEPFHLLDHLLSHNFYENQPVVSQNICRKITNVSSNSKYLYLPHNSKSLMQGKMYDVYAVNYSFCWCLYVRLYMLQIAGLSKMLSSSKYNYVKKSSELTVHCVSNGFKPYMTC